MICPIPDSNGFPEPDTAVLTERWSDEARVGALAARRTGSKYKTKKDKERDRQKGDPGFADRAAQDRVAAHVQGRTGAHDAARMRAQGDYKRISDERAAKKAKEEAEAKKAEKAKGGGGGKADAKPKRTGEETNAKGERVVKYSDGSTVTVGKDGSATRKKPDGTEVKGKYTDPKPKGEPEPEGFRGETQADKDRATQKAESERKKSARTASPRTRRATFYRAKLSRTKKGPIAGTGGRYA